MAINKSTLLKAILAVLLAGVAGFFATSAVAKPVITWTPVYVSESIEQGAATQVSVSVSSSETISGATFFLTPELAPFVTVPTAPLNLQAGVPQQFGMSVAIPSEQAFGQSFDGTLHVRAGGATVSRPLPVSLEILEQTLIGKDQDGDGVWDEVEEAISDVYPSDLELRAVQRFGAKALQETLSAGDSADLTAINAAAQQRSNWVACLVSNQVIGGHDAGFARKQVAILRSLLINNPRRIEAYRRSEELLAGSIVDASDFTIEQCINGA